MHSRTVRLGVVGVLVLALGVLAGLAWWWLGRAGDFERAVGTLPADTLRASYTDWAAVRAAADGNGLDAASSEAEVDAFLHRAFDRGLASTSAMSGSTFALTRHYGVSPLDAEWEMLGQARSGQVVVLAVDEGADLEGAERSLRRLGYTAPADGAGAGGTWQGSADLTARIDPDLTPVQENVAVLPEERLVVMSDNAAPVSATVEVIRGGAEGLEAPLVGSAGTPTSAVLWASDFACADLAMSAADEEDQRVADTLVREAGGVSPLSGLLIAQQPDRTISVGMRFESDDQASENLQPRVDLAAGEAPGQGGTFAERFAVTSGEASGSDVVLTLDPRPGQRLLFGDITTGPVLFATC